MHACRGGTYPIISSRVTTFHGVESFPPIIDGPASSSSSATLVALRLDLIFHVGDFGLFAPLFFFVILGKMSQSPALCFTMVTLTINESYVLPLEMASAIVVNLSTSHSSLFFINGLLSQFSAQ